LRIEVLAVPFINDDVLQRAYEYDVMPMDASWTTDIDALGEAAGRICYKSFGRKNAATAANPDYLANIIAQGHFSVMEHASVTFLVRGVSRALLTELTRHRHLSFSVVSQRYVNYAETEPVIPPAMRGTALEESLRSDYAADLMAYADYVVALTEAGLSRKAAREAARAVLPNAAPVDMIVTGNLRAWRDVLGKRWHVAADAEIREFAGRILADLRRLAPSSVQDIPTEPYE
jgi:thymidylate synthase (FAD)